MLLRASGSGGVRSIMQLEILQRIEREISLVDIPIGKYFDLIVGTR